MNKKDRLGFVIRNKAYNLLYWFLTVVLTVKLSGSIQDLINKKEVNQYKEIVRDFGNFLRSNGIEDPVDVFDYYNYALWGGYLSKDHIFQYNVNRDLFFSTYGLGCILGDSVCLNNAGMLSDLYESLGYDSGIITCYAPHGVNIDSVRNQDYITREVEQSNDSLVDLSFIFDDISHPSSDSIVREVELSGDYFIDFSFILDAISHITGNHAVTLVDYDNEYYYFDPTNLAYLFKSGPYSLDVINGEGSLSKRQITSLIFSDLTVLRGIFVNNKKGYDLDYLNNREDVNIDVEKLEEFYYQEKELIDSIADSMHSKSQYIILLIALILSIKLSEAIISSGERIISKKNRKNEISLVKLISLFMEEYGIKNFEDICGYLSYLIDNGYLTWDQNYVRIKKSIFLESTAFVTIDKEKYGKDFFKNYLGRVFDNFSVIGGVDDQGKYQEFYVYLENNKYLFYSYQDNLVYHLNDDLELVNGDKFYKFKLSSKWKRKFSKSEKDRDDVIVNVDEQVCRNFASKAKPVVEEIAKTYAYVPKK